MSRILALEWDTHEARVAVGRKSGKRVVLEHALAVDLSSRGGDSSDGDDVKIGDRLAAAMSAHGIGRGETLVAVGRANIELRLLSVPPAPDDELPDIVRFQAMRQFTSIADNWPLDYCRLDAAGDAESVSVLAAAISPDLIAQIQQACQVGGLTPQRIVLRPFAAASLLRRRGVEQDCVMMVDLLTDEADLTVLVDRQVVFMRTVRVGSSEHRSAQQIQALLGEIRRTIVASQNQLGGRSVERIFVCGDDSSHEDLKQQLGDELSLPIESFDPFADFKLAAELDSQRPDNPGRFAPLLGMLADEAAGERHSIDLLHPRKKTPPRNQLQRVAAMAGVLAAVALVIFGIVWAQLREMDKEIVRLRERSTGLDDVLTAAYQQQADVAEIDKFTAGEVLWLDELRELSLEFPASEDAIVTKMLLMAEDPRVGGGKMILEGYVTQSATIDALESALRDPRHVVTGTGGKEDKSQRVYRWRFAETIGVMLPESQLRGEMAPAGNSTDRDDIAGAIRTGATNVGGSRP